MRKRASLKLALMAGLVGTAMVAGMSGAGAQTVAEAPTQAKLRYKKTSARRGVFKTVVTSEQSLCEGTMLDGTDPRKVKLIRLGKRKRVIGTATTNARGVAKFRVRHRAVNNDRFRARVPAKSYATYAQLLVCGAATSNRVRP